MCEKEKFYILFRPESASVNSRDEIFFFFTQAQKFNAFNPQEKKKVGPGCALCDKKNSTFIQTRICKH